LRDANYLEHILEAIDKAQRYVLAFDEAKFMARKYWMVSATDKLASSVQGR